MQMIDAFFTPALPVCLCFCALQMIENNDYLYLIMEYCSGGELF